MSPPARPKRELLPVGGTARSAKGAPASGAARREAAASGVPSPCVSICKLDATGTQCVGCFRTLDEIAAWSVLDDSAKRAVLAALPLRKAAEDLPERRGAAPDHELFPLEGHGSGPGRNPGGAADEQ